MSELKLGQDRAYLDKKAKQEGLIVFLPEADEVFLDLDHPVMEMNLKVRTYLEVSMGIHVVTTLGTVSKSHNTHVYMRMDRNLGELERVILQVCLGSDPVKELFSFIQLHYMDKFWPDFSQQICECPIALFETRAEAIRVREWRANR